MSGEELDRLLASAIEWLARLPLCGERELAQLLGVHEQDARAVRHELERRGWVDWIVPGTAGLEPRRLCFLREEAGRALAEHARAGEPALRELPLRERDVLDRVARVEITAGVNRLFADLASALQGTGIELADARSLPTRGGVRPGWELPAVEGYGCLRWGERWAPFFVAWDRAGASDAHRRGRVSAWARAADAVGERTAPILVVAAGERELSRWEARVQRYRDAGRWLGVLLGSARDVLQRGPAAPIWRGVEGSDRKPLVESLPWGPKPARRPASFTAARELLAIDAVRRPLREWAPRAATGQVPESARERVAAIALATDAEEKRILDWVARHPLLSAGELATLLDAPAPAVRRRLDWLVRCEAVVVAGAPSPRVRAVDADRYLSSIFGLRLLAALDRVPPLGYARDAGLTVADGGGAELGCRALRHAAHTIGVNRTLARLAADARTAGGRLVEWRNEAESARRFRVCDHTRWIRPDASGVLRGATGAWPFLLEYDRGTLDGGDYRAKLAGYEAYFASRAWAQDFEAPPALMFVCANEHAERRVARATAAHAPALPLVLTTEWRFERASAGSKGLTGAIWARPGDRRLRVEPFRTEVGR